MLEYDFKRVAENLFIRVSTGRYYLILKRNGNQIRKSLKTKIRSIANAKLESELAKLGHTKIHKGKQGIPIFKASYEAAIEVAKSENLLAWTIRTLKNHLSLAANSFLGEMRVSDIDETHLIKYLRKRSLDTSGRTANLDLQALRRFFSVAVERGWIWRNPAKEIPAFEHKYAKRHIPTSDDVYKVLSYLRKGHWHTSVDQDRKKAADFLEFLAFSGVRLGGAQTIKWQDVNFEKGYFEVTEKGEKTRRVNLFPQLREFLFKIKKEAGQIFPGPLYCPKKVLDNVFNEEGFENVKRFTFHALRHYFTTECLERGISPPVIAGWLGHADNGILVMKTYGNHIRTKHFESEAQKVYITVSTPENVAASPNIDQCPAV